jgi:pyruvate/2-oxoacid:ferredoxin oxidoreductase alpha subunit
MNLFDADDLIGFAKLASEKDTDLALDMLIEITRKAEKVLFSITSGADRVLALREINKLRTLKREFDRKLLKP